MVGQAQYLLKLFNTNRYIFNLGHGVLQNTPVENVMKLSKLIQNWSA